MGNKISNTDIYPKKEASNISLKDFAIGTSGEGDDKGKTINIPLAVLVGLIETTEVLTVNLTNATQIQDEYLEGASGVRGFTQGQEIWTGGFAESFDSNTGTLTISSNFTPFTGEVILVRQ